MSEDPLDIRSTISILRDRIIPTRNEPFRPSLNLIIEKKPWEFFGELRTR